MKTEKIEVKESAVSSRDLANHTHMEEEEQLLSSQEKSCMKDKLHLEHAYKGLYNIRLTIRL